MAHKRNPKVAKKPLLDKKTLSEEKSSSSNDKNLNKVQVIIGLIATSLMIIISLLGFPTKVREFIGPTGTPTSISYGNRCKQVFDTSQVEYANLPEVLAVSDQKVLQIQLHLIDNIVGIDLGCEANVPFNAQIETTMVKGDSTNFACLAFGGKLAPQGTLENYFAFCISDAQKWLLLHVDSQKGKQILAEDLSNEILGSNGRNLINIKVSRTDAEFLINGHSVEKVSNMDLKSNKVIGLAWAVPKDATTLPIWQADNLNVWELNNNAPPTSTNFSLAFVNVSYQLPSSSMTPAITETSPTITNLRIQTPIQVSENIATYVLLDQSKSMVEFPNSNDVSKQLLEGILGIALPQDFIGIATFADQTKILLPITRVKDIDPIRDQPRLFNFQSMETGPSDNLASALNVAYSELQGVSNNVKKHVLVITDNRNLSATPEQEMQFRETIRKYRAANLQLDVVVLQGETTPGKPFVSLLEEEGVNFVTYDATRFSDSPGVALNAFYHNYTDRSANIQFPIDSQHSYQLSIPPNAEKLVLFISSSGDDPVLPESNFITLTSPSGNQYGRGSQSSFSTFVQQKPEAGLWTVDVSSSQRKTFNGYSLILLSSNP
jgi:hypothetical protein